MLESQTAPLLNRPRHSPIAYLTRYNGTTGVLCGELSVEQFISHVNILAQKLPDATHVINLCGNRYLFMVAFCAVIVRSQTNLLPPNKNRLTQATLIQRYPNTYVVHDGLDELADCETIDLSKMSLEMDRYGSDDGIPEIALSHIAAISFTSGSTGDSQPNLKTWQTFVESTKINYQHMLADQKRNRQIPEAQQAVLYQLATVPGQHMWGLETSILMPLFYPLCVADAKPFFPQDVAECLAQLPRPKIMVSTPVHLRSFVISDLDFEPLDAIFCATAPLSQEAASQAENCFQAELREVYGCTEVGSMAIRRTAINSDWQGFKGIHFRLKDKGQSVLASTAYLPNEVLLQDKIELLENRCFRLVGRNADLINIAGKRGSLSELNRVLLSFPGVLDGAVFLPKENHGSATISRLVALVALPQGVTKEDVRLYFAAHVDSVFVPRPIITVDALPREENGKLGYQRLMAFYDSLRKQSS